jgi:hypothetical protein
MSSTYRLSLGLCNTTVRRIFLVVGPRGAATGVAHLVANHGRMRLLVGAQLTEGDVGALHGGSDLAETVAVRMMADIETMVDAVATERLAALAWMVQQGRTLELRVVLPKGPDGHPLPAGICQDYYHPKTGIFTDEAGNQLVFTGSINESEQAWLHNYEMFSVYRSWTPGLQGYITTHGSHFDQLWNDREENWIALPIPQAVRERLLRFCPPEAPTSDPQEKPKPVTPTPEAAPGIPYRRCTARASAASIPGVMLLIWQTGIFPRGGRLHRSPLATHQAHVVDPLVGHYPQSVHALRRGGTWQDA